MSKVKQDNGQLTSSYDKPDRKKDLREKVNLILPDGLMILLALIMVPVVLIPLLATIPEYMNSLFNFIDYAILSVFIIEYMLKTILAPNILKHAVNPWHLLDLFIIAVPLVNLFTATFARFGNSSILLRLLRILRLLAIGGRAADRRAALTSPPPRIVKKTKTHMEIQIMDGKLENKYENVPLNDLRKYLDSPTHTWVHVSPVVETDFELLSNMLGIPKILLEDELVDESYPRVDYFEHYATIFARIADVQICDDPAARLSINRTGLLAICWKQNVITISKEKTDLFDQILDKAKKVHQPSEPVVVTILYSIMKYILEKDKEIVVAIEGELITLEGTPLKKRPASFLETTFYLRKEVTQLVPSLLHLKEIISSLTSKRIPLEGFNERHVKVFDILIDEAVYLHETTCNARDNLQSLVDLYMNTTAFETNKVMRVIAIITSLGVIPAILGLLGSNIVGNPWNIQLWQVYAGLGMSMIAMGWIFYRLGWLKS